MRSWTWMIVSNAPCCDRTLRSDHHSVRFHSECASQSKKRWSWVLCLRTKSRYRMRRKVLPLRLLSSLLSSFSDGCVLLLCKPFCRIVALRLAFSRRLKMDFGCAGVRFCLWDGTDAGASSPDSNACARVLKLSYALCLADPGSAQSVWNDGFVLLRKIHLRPLAMSVMSGTLPANLVVRISWKLILLPRKEVDSY